MRGHRFDVDYPARAVTGGSEETCEFRTPDCARGGVNEKIDT